MKSNPVPLRDDSIREKFACLNQRKSRCCDGFTFIECIAGIFLIGILIAALAPILAQAKSAAEGIKCASNLRNLALAGQTCIAEQNGRLLDAMYWRASSGTGSILPYLGVSDATYSPNAPSPLSCPTAFRLIGKNGDFNRHYTINVYVCASESGRRDGEYAANRLTLMEFTEMSATAFFMDGHFFDPASSTAERKMDARDASVRWSKGKRGWFAEHSGRGNIVFLDGHVELRRSQDIPRSRTNKFWGAR